MGPNPVKLTEELMTKVAIPKGSLVMDLGSGTGITSLFLSKEYGHRVIAADLWSNPTENMRFFESEGLGSLDIMPIHADANDLPFAHGFFDAVISTDSYNYFGRDSKYLGEKLLPFVKTGGFICICVPGMKKDCHEDLPKELLASWSPEQLDYIHDIEYWGCLIEQTKGIRILSLEEMESNEEVWADWLACENEDAVSDRKAFDAGGGKFLNFISIIVQKKE
ncbi:MAG TPA: methyltransferase domain-containing protein [Methanocorpusculum sp.]|nr:methyltransferase domain-containing protein [Methanocorpusculum sp.]